MAGNDRNQGTADLAIPRLLSRFADATLALPDWSCHSSISSLVETVWRGQSGIRDLTSAEVDSFAQAVYSVTRGFETTYLRLILHVADRVRDGGDVAIREILRPDIRAQAGTAPGLLLLKGLATGLAGKAVPFLFLPDDTLPDVVGQSRDTLSARYYYLNLVLEQDARRWLDQALAEGIGGACAGEIMARLERYPRSIAVWRAVETDSVLELRSLFLQVARNKKDPDTESIFNETLAKEINGQSALEIACGCLDGKFESIDASFHRDLIDQYRKERRQRRVPKQAQRQLSALAREDAEPLLLAGARGFRRAGARRVSIPPVVSAEEDEIVFRLTLERLRSPNADDPKVAKLLEGILRRPELTVHERAAAHRITERTLLNWRVRLGKHFTPVD